ncbi:MAG TPA: cytidine deaminase [Rhodanobacteraceae bacterium]|nr:cytidine deaminase [Rhodanobacteraceae bacterium]
MSPMLRAAASAAANSAYAPYSHIFVGAALRSALGRVYAGCNVENASFPVGNCAERAALAAAVLAEGKAFELQSIAIVARDARGRELSAPPCGACRQALIEFGPQAQVDFIGPDGQWLTVIAGDLLPHRFAFPPA